MENPAFVMELEGEGANPKAGKTEKAYSFEEAVSFAGTGKYHYFLLLVCGCCFMTVMVETMGISIIMPFLKCDIPSSVDEQGFLASAGFLGVVLSSHLMGFLADTWGRVRTLRTALLCSCVSTMISAFSVNIWMLIVFRFLNGFFISGCQACIFSYMGEFHKKSTRARYVTLLAMFLPMTLIYLPGLARMILPLTLDIALGGDFRFTPWRLLLLLNATLNLIALCGLFIFPESPRYVLIQGRHDEALETLKRMFARNTGRPESEYPVERIDIDISGANLRGIHGVKDALKTVWSQTTPLFYKERAPYTLILCFLLFFIFAIGQGTIMWLPTLLDQLVATKNQGYLFCESMYMIDSSINATITSDTCNGPVNPDMFYVLIFMGAAFTVLGLVFATFIDFVGKKSLLIISFSIIAVSNLLIHWVSSFNMSMILITLIMSTGNCASIVSAIAIEFFPTNISAMGMCLIMMVGRFGSAVGSNIIGKAIMNGCDSLFYTFMGIVIVAACFVKVLPNEEAKKQTNSGASKDIE